jgi:glycerol-3-phosphate responsive antiterminator
MNALIPEVMTAAMQTIAQHYATKMKAQGMSPTQEEIHQAMQNNWEKVSQEIASLYAESIELLRAA